MQQEEVERAQKNETEFIKIKLDKDISNTIVNFISREDNDTHTSGINQTIQLIPDCLTY